MKRLQRMLAGTLSAALLAGLLTVGASAAGFTRSKTYTAGQFTDVAAGAWYAASVKDCFELGLMSGSSATTFNPNGMFTVAEAATIAARMHHIYTGGNGTIPAAAGPWYQGAVDYCVKNGIFAAGDFDSYTRSATRAEMAGMMAAALPDAAWTAKNSVTALPDVAAGTPNAEAIFQLYNAGVFTGSDEYGMFQPYAYITRAEVAAIAARCADPAQRKTLTLTPMSQRTAPAIPGSEFGKMSNGRLRFQDPDTKLWGYLDGNGTVVIPAKYKSVDNFSGGYAVVTLENNQKQLLDLTGRAVSTYTDLTGTTSSNHFPDGVFSFRRDGTYGLIIGGKEIHLDAKDSGGLRYLGYGFFEANRGLLDSNGTWMIPAGSDLSYEINDSYIFACHYNPKQVDVYDHSGKLLQTFETSEMEYSDKLFAVGQGNKYALATEQGLITEAVYDEIQLKGKDLALLKIGNQVGLGGLNGEIIAPGVYRSYCVDKTYALFANEEVYGLATNSGVQWTNQVSGIMEVGKDKFIYADSFRVDEDLGLLMLSLKESGLSAYSNIHSALLDLKGNIVSNNISRTMLGGDAVQYEDTQSGEIWVFNNQGKPYEEPKEYKIMTESGKPYLAYGNKADGYVTVIQYYQNNLCYDEIKALGEEYYACRYNTTWYLVHA